MPNGAVGLGIAALAVVSQLLAVMGCSNEPFKMKRVSGRITYEDGTPLPTDGVLRLTFYSDQSAVDGKFHPRPGSAMPNAEGYFTEAITRRPGDGLVTGTHQVTIGYMGRDTKGIVPDEYTIKGKSPLSVDTSEQPFELRVPRP